jgi:hypothetical protein
MGVLQSAPADWLGVRRLLDMNCVIWHTGLMGNANTP